MKLRNIWSIRTANDIISLFIIGIESTTKSGVFKPRQILRKIYIVVLLLLKEIIYNLIEKSCGVVAYVLPIHSSSGAVQYCRIASLFRSGP